jgi:hypothetical protein
METQRRQYANQIYSEIKSTEISIKRDKEAQKNIRNMGLSSELLHKKQSELEDNITRKEAHLKTLNDRRESYLSGELDDEINKEMKNNIIVPKKTVIIKTVIKKPIFYKRSRIEPSERDIHYYYRQFCKADELLPDYMRANLNNMPNNKGYIWRGCMFFGKLNSEPGKPKVLFEKLRGGDMKIHEFDKTHYTITEKKRRNY